MSTGASNGKECGVPEGSVEIKAAANYSNKISISLNQQNRAGNLKATTSPVMSQCLSFCPCPQEEKAEMGNVQVKMARTQRRYSTEQLISINTFKDLLFF